MDYIPIEELPKPELEEKKDRVNIWVKSIGSLLLYLALAYIFFSHKFTFLLIITAIIIFHELGHFTAMKVFKYNELGIFFIPLLGAYVSGTKQEVSQKQSAIILLAGPVPGILLGILILILLPADTINIAGERLDTIASLLILVNLLNLLPVYPLDGGQLLHRLFLDEYKIIGRIFVIISAILLVYFSIKFFLPLLIFPFFMITRLISEIVNERVISKIESENIDLTRTYDELSAEEYWKIRNVIIKHYPQLRDVKPSPPYEISPKEDQVITTIQGLLQRSLIQDLSPGGKLFIILIWIGCFFTPFLFEISLRFFG